MDSFDTATSRDPSGRFTPGTSGNPAGKRPGTRNRKTVLAEALREGEDHGIARVVIDKALSGDAVTARFLLGLLTPKPRGRAIELDLPADARAGDVVAAFDATLAAMAAGEITPDEALIVTRVLDGKRRALEAVALERKLAEDAAREEAAATAATDSADVQVGTPGTGEVSEDSLHFACILPDSATMRGIVAGLPPAERHLVATLIRERRAASARVPTAA